VGYHAMIACDSAIQGIPDTYDSSGAVSTFLKNASLVGGILNELPPPVIVHD